MKKVSLNVLFVVVVILIFISCGNPLNDASDPDGTGDSAITVLPPSFSISPGTYRKPIALELTAETAGSVIHYTTNGSEPTSSSPAYSAPISLNQEGIKTVKAVAVKEGTASTVTAGTYTLQFIKIRDIDDSSADYRERFENPVIYNDVLYFEGTRDSDGLERPFSVSGSVIAEVSAVLPQYEQQFVDPIVYNETICFGGHVNPTTDSGFFTFNGTSYTQITGLTGDYNYWMYHGIVYNNNLYFLGYDDSGVQRIFEFDGTSVNEVNAGSSGYNDFFYEAVVYSGNLCFNGQNASGVNYLYIFDGSSISTPTNTSDYAKGFSTPLEYEGKLYFSGQTAIGTSKMYCLNGTGVEAVSTGSSDYKKGFSGPIIYNDVMFFSGTDTSDNPAVFFCDGSVIHDVDTGSLLLVDLNSAVIYQEECISYGVNASFEFSLHTLDENGISEKTMDLPEYEEGFYYPLIYDGYLIFGGSDSASENHLYIYDGTTLNLIESASSDIDLSAVGPSGIIEHSGKVYFKAVDSSGKNRIFGLW